MIYEKPNTKPDKKGGNCDVFFDGDFAYKFLRNTSSPEKIKRFIQECNVCKGLIGNPNLKIAEIVSVYSDDKVEKTKWYIQMKKYNHVLSDLLTLTKGDAKFICEHLLPIVKTLYELSTQTPPIYHRDIKPDNILCDDDNNLYLSDFGICYINDGKTRFTQTSEAIGARLFMAPEYEVGKVDNISEKGDIFSIGKLLWYLANGEMDSFLPYNLWYIDKYNLTNKFNNENIIKLTQIIAKCTEIDQNKRCNYTILMKDMENLINNNNDVESIRTDIKLQSQIELANQKEQIVIKENELFLMSVNNIIKEAIKLLFDNYSSSRLVTELYNKFRPETFNYTYFAENGSGSYVIARELKNSIMFNCRLDANNICYIEIMLRFNGTISPDIYNIKKINDSIQYNGRFYDIDGDAIKSIYNFIQNFLKLCYNT